jgi:SAM-dependent methyltransferase
MFGVINSSAQNVLVQWIVQKELRNLGQTYISGRLLDIGCGTKPYEKLFADFNSEHIGVDHPGTLHGKSKIDVLGSAYNIPFMGDSFNSVICTATLEHLEEPEIALHECFRVLKPNSYAIYTIPFIWHIHEEPRDFFRYSKFGIDYLFKKAGFNIIEIKALSGFWVTFGQLFVYNIFRLNKGPIRWLHLLDVPCLLIQLISFCFDKIDKTEEWTWMYIVIANKV